MSAPKAHLESELITCPRCRLNFLLGDRATQGDAQAEESGPGTATILPEERAPRPATPTGLPSRIGRFEIRRYLGEGVFGLVYLAHDTLLKRDVALKVAKPEQLSGQRRVERFQREARAAANLQHPHIVAIFDSGQDGGHHFIASAYIAGRSLHAILEERPEGKTLERRQAVQIVRQLAEALGYAHKQGVVHRDVKPGNVMLREDGEALLMDFGVAARLDETEKLTVAGQFMGTPEYAAPEQWRGAARAASDQYSLGCLLFELLTGERPFAGSSSEHYLMLHTTQPAPSPRKYRPDLPRDLETIVLKCLEKEPERRYGDCQALADDLRRYLEGEPVKARPVGRLERAWRWGRRNPAVASMLAALIVVMAGSLAALSALYVNAERQRQMAEHREAGALAITRFYENNVLAAARPKGWDGGAGKNVTLREAMDRSAPEIERAFDGQPELEAAVRNTLGMTYYYLAQFKAANFHLEKAYAIRREQLGEEHPDTLTSLQNLASVAWREGKFAEAEAMGRRVLSMRRRVLGPEHEDTLWTQLRLGLFLLEQDKLDEAERFLRPGIELCKRTLGPDHVSTLFGQSDLAWVVWTKGKDDEAVALDRETLAGRRRTLGADNPDTLRSMGNLGFRLGYLGKLEEGEALTRQSLEAKRRVLGAEHIETLMSELYVGDVLARRGKYAEAEKILRHGVGAFGRLQGAKHPYTLWAMAFLGEMLTRADRAAEAEPVLRECLAQREKILAASDWEIGNTRALLGHCLARQGKLAAGEALLVAGHERMAKGAPSCRVGESLGWISELYEKWGKPEQARAWRKKRGGSEK
jgi:tRNA A-37 threonylcarbamoyl transferase component Bud32/tetratricopeptide (TPR) repeat protein